MAEKIALSERTHPLYDSNIDNWNLYFDSVKGGDNFINDDNLFSHRLEEAEDFDERLDRSYYLNFCDAIPTIYNSYIFKKEIERPPDDDIKDFRKNVDGMNTTINEFVKKVGFFASVFGVMHALVDIPDSPKKKLSVKDQREQNIIPYASLVYPSQLKDWSLDSNGDFNWVVIESTYYNDADPNVEREENKHYKLITKEEWRIEDEDGNTPKFDEEGLESSGQNTLGFVPMITMYHKDISDDKVGESVLKDIVYVNRAIMNWCSCIDEQIERQTFSQLIVPDMGELSDEEEKGGDPLTNIGTSSIWTFNAESKHPPAFISPDVEHIQLIWRLVVDHIKEIFRMAGLVGSSEDMYVSRSGRAAQMGFLSVNSVLAEKAGKYQKFEDELSRLAYLQLGKNPSDYVGVKYPTSFDVQSLSEEIDASFKIMERNLSTLLNKTMSKNIARRAVPQAPEDIRSQIESEIDSGTGIINPVSKGEEKPSEEDGNPSNRQGATFDTKDEKEDRETKKEKEEK